jgi:XTP/dITP diphosphohydrolase
MSREILFATTNPHKKERFQYYFKTLGLSVISFSDIKDKVEVVEDGKTPEENALKKAIAGYESTHIPTFGVDYWLRIEGFPKNIQPGPYVRRIFVGKDNKRKEAGDKEMLEYYIKKIKVLGGKTKGFWTSAIGLVIDPNHIYSESFTTETVLTSEKSPNKTEGEPLNSLQIDPKSGKYFTDLTLEEWLNLQKEREKGYLDFMIKHLQEI